jgi:hypothetical protein
MLDDLKNVHLKTVIQYSFAQHLQANIANIQDGIQASVILEMDDFFLRYLLSLLTCRIQERSRMIGKVAMSNTRTRKATVVTQREAAIKTQFSTSTNMDVLIDIAMSEEETVDVFDASGCELDFRPLYQSCHIHETLERLDEFKSVYEDKRRVFA